HVDTGVEIASDAAQERARAALRAPDAAAFTSTALEVWPIEGTLALVWVVGVEDRSARALVRANGPRAGEVEVIDERLDATAGAVSGWIADGGAPGGHGVARRVALTDVAVKAGTSVAYTNATGRFSFSGSVGSTVRVALSGRAARVIDAANRDASAAASPSSAMQLVLGDASEDSLAQVTAYQAITDERAWLVDNAFPTSELGAPLTARVNVDDTCNAYYSPPARALNFFRSGGGCRNTAELSVVAHEYGHFVDDRYGGIMDAGLSEGWGDALSCLFRGDPQIGPDVIPGETLRTCDNDYVFPDDGHDEAHALGQAWSGFVWHVRAGLGDALARKLVLPSLRTNAADIPSAVREVFLRDDDDGDLSNGTPHFAILIAAARRHGLDFAIETDPSAPGEIADLHATSAHATSIAVAWTAPADGNGDRVARYELRWSRTRITETNFDAAHEVTAPHPALPDHAQHATVRIPAGASKIYIAVRSIDRLGNASPISNVVLVHPSAPRVAFQDPSFAEWTHTGLWHASSRRGESALWFGDEARGTYDVGASSGELVSPVIDLTALDHPALAWREWLEVEGDPAFDRATITVTDVDDPTRSVTASREHSSTDGLFDDRALELDALAGRRVRITIRFDTGDAHENQFEGWYVSDVRVVAEP
ncbi:MAG TPA: hypothetical protein VL463_22380, partial [Kofleriaceae bacterium]|nr:hypothetical protein [Kofleriaceae bacterium]